MTVRTLLVRGLVAGVAAGVLSWLFSYLFGEPALRDALAFEGHAHGEELVSRGVQSTIGLGTALVLYGVAIGGLFALAYAVAYGRIGSLGPRATAAVLAAGAFVVVFLVPFLKYPANPPAATDDSTVGQRTGLYLVLVLVSVLLAVGSVLLGRRLHPRVGARNAVLLGGGLYLAAITVVLLVLPTVSQPPADFPATVLYEFRLASVGNQVVLWATIGLVFGVFTARALPRSRAASVDSEVAP
ncbi:MAG: CbtA family protein [Geodermatophilaceae bacterium]|nr:CbtA family protein [Geodermatophilaceae bacterium]MDQ3454812.1 CbtA family protein [Actinomycetota bacterium]